jgi:hypothetical protein
MEESGGNMSLLEQQIKELQLRKSKADLFKLVLEEIQTNPKKEQFAEVYEDVMAELAEFVSSRVAAIENGEERQPEKTPAELTEDDKTLLLALARRAKERVAQPENNGGAFANEDITIPKAPARQQNPQKQAKRQDMLQFAQQHRHLDRKRVTVHTPQGDVGGTVVGAIAPNLIIKTDTGHEVPVPPENITVE